MSFDPIVAGVTLGGSLLSAVSSFCVLACFVYFNQSQRSFRHALVFNLTLADFINATNNGISGIIYVRDKQLSPGVACGINGWLGQLSVQATDFSVLAISIATLLVVTQTGRVMNASTMTKTIMCLSVWILPIVTSTTALGMGQMAPVSGNWCWISRDRTDLRYALAHGWRFAVIAVTICTYTYIWIYITRHFKSLGSVSTRSRSGSSASWRCKGSSSMSSPGKRSVDFGRGQGQFRQIADPEHGSSMASSEELVSRAAAPAPQYRGITATTTITTTTTDRAVSHPHKSQHQRDLSSTSITQAASDQFRARSQKIEREIKKMLLLNGYPICYVMLWIPGITNRIIEASGSKVDNRVIATLQASTQFIGFANAVTYGLNQQWRGR
ncbi:G protein-coupled glucose receptor regulating Gpa2-domain-containing protein [Microdochium bolleyi]|uniref:G protein-coupled glucose receptor regulating Gpa2-domain-containing protein n=1 Tax=Microdochium bolleyi TaxID=196109 RepID=A0A136JI99_9PEZI|nr:G protein-coupled glucose receptor regulating Gpa2-domain-containing protein [Microdochium bolleyi]